MSARMHCRIYLLLCTLTVAAPAQGFAQSKPDTSTSSARQPRVERDGQRDFDFEIGTWKTHLRRRLRPLTGSNEWVEYEGTTIVRKAWDGDANLVELVADGPAGHFEGLSLRLYDPEARQWSLNFSNRRSGTLTPPVIGEFRDGRGEFYGQDVLDGRTILVRFIIAPIGPDSCRFEQSFSDDGGKTWELNWVVVDTRVADSDHQAAHDHRDAYLQDEAGDA